MSCANTYYANEYYQRIDDHEAEYQEAVEAVENMSDSEILDYVGRDAIVEKAIEKLLNTK